MRSRDVSAQAKSTRFGLASNFAPLPATSHNRTLMTVARRNGGKLCLKTRMTDIYIGHSTYGLWSEVSDRSNADHVGVH